MARLIVLLTTCLALSAQALTLADVRTALQGKGSKDTLEVKMHTTVQVMGQTQVMDMHMVQKGADKMWMEMTGALLSQRMIRNGSRMQVTDLKTNQSKIMPFDLSQIPTQAGPQQLTDPLGDLQWGEPVKQSDGQYLLSSAIRDLVFDARKGRVSSITDRGMQGLTTETVIGYCDGCTVPNTPKSLRTSVSGTAAGGMSTSVQVDITTWKTSTNLPDRIFEF